MIDDPPPPRLRPWSMNNGRRVGSYRVFDVEQHDVVDGSGRARGDVYTFRCPDWCNVIPVTEDGHVVLVWQYRFGTHAPSLELPGGIIDPGEEPIEAARRELLEETGYAGDPLEPLGWTEPNPGLQNNRCWQFVARNVSLAGSPSFDPLEELEVVLVPLAAVPGLIDRQHVKHALVVVALERFLRHEASQRRAHESRR